jgi:hypothetical protein
MTAWFASRPPRRLSLGFLLIHCAIPLWIGGWIYLLFRTESLLMFRWAETLGWLDFVQDQRTQWGPLRALLPGWVLYSLPDGVWVYVSTAFFGRLWRTGPLIPHLFWTGIASALALGGEFGQALGMVPGTFSWPDVLLYVLAALVSYWVAAVR